MKSITRLVLGFLSSVFVSVGLLRAAQVCDPHVNSGSIRQASSLHAADGCTSPCNLAQE